jgi:Arc/MetJ family transcription regulator
MTRRTTIEIDEALLERAQHALGQPTMRATVEEALRRAADQADRGLAERARKEREFFDLLPKLVDVDVLASEEMWR